jgi:preprotein translocase subunit SecG
MLAFVIVLQVLVALFLIMVVLLQPGNRGGASAALGGAGSDTVFGGRGANTFLSKITFGAAVCFMVTNFALSYMSSSSIGEKSVLDALEQTKTKKAEEEVKPESAPSENKPVDGMPQVEPPPHQDLGEGNKGAP